MSNKVCPHNCVADCSECELEEKKLKALDVIREKSIDVHSFLIGINLNTYEDFIQKGRKYGWYTNEPTQKEFDLLKEVLSCQQ